MQNNKRTVFTRYINTEEMLNVPLSKNRYKINIFGIIKNQQDVLLPISRDEKNNLVVNIDWYDGIKSYLLADVIAHTFKPILVNYKYWHLIKVLFADGNNQNLFPSNLVWKFPIGLGEEQHNGFAFIPMFTRYMINRNGVVFDMKMRRIVEGHFNVGYHSFVLVPDVGQKTSLKRHRGLCLAFKDYPHNVESLDVNHKNGISNDDSLDNLEFCTPSENIKHAFQNGLRTSDLTPILVRDVRTGEINEYDSIVSCAKSLGINVTLINGRIKTPNSFLKPDGLQFKRKKDLTPWYIPKYPEEEILEISWKKSVLMLNLLTKEVTEFPSQHEASNYFGFVEAVFSRWLKEKDQRVYKKDNNYYLVKHLKDKTPWRHVENPELDYLIKTMKYRPVLLKDVSSGKITQYPSAAECARALNVLTTTLNYRLSHKGQKMFSDGTQVKYLDEILPFSEIDGNIVSILSSAPYN